MRFVDSVRTIEHIAYANGDNAQRPGPSLVIQCLGRLLLHRSPTTPADVEHGEHRCVALPAIHPNLLPLAGSCIARLRPRHDWEIDGRLLEWIDVVIRNEIKVSAPTMGATNAKIYMLSRKCYMLYKDY